MVSQVTAQNKSNELEVDSVAFMDSAIKMVFESTDLSDLNHLNFPVFLSAAQTQLLNQPSDQFLKPRAVVEPNEAEQTVVVAERSDVADETAPRPLDVRSTSRKIVSSAKKTVKSRPTGPVLPRRLKSKDDAIRLNSIICLEDGASVKDLAQHLRQIGMPISEYLSKWDLPNSYPMKAPLLSQKKGYEYEYDVVSKKLVLI